MTRSKRFISGLVSSYASIGVNIVYTIASVPLALHYLNKEEFGLWALVTQLSGYLLLLEFGMSGSVARFLTDYKDDINGGIYGSILRTGSVVFVLQGIVVVAAGIALAMAGPTLLDLTSGNGPAFTVLMSLQALLTGCKLAAASVVSPLWSHQRLDISNLGSCFSLAVNFAILWLGFHLGWKLHAMVAATAAGLIASLVVCYVSCRKLGLYPDRSAQGTFDRQLLKEMSGFGGGIFLMNVGAQLASASHIILVSRLLGLEAASVWSISTKVSTLALLFVGRILDSSAGGFAEIVVRSDKNLLLRRFRDIVTLTAILAMTATAGIAIMNESFLEIWTKGRIAWPAINNLLLGAVLFVTCVTRCHTGLVGIHKQIRGMKYVYLFEGFLFIASAIVLGHFYHFTGILIAALASNVLVTGIYGIRRSAAYFGIEVWQVARWIARPLSIFPLVISLFFLIQIPTILELSAYGRFAAGGASMVIIVAPTLWMLGLHRDMRHEMRAVFQSASTRFRLGIRKHTP